MKRTTFFFAALLIGSTLSIAVDADDSATPVDYHLPSLSNWVASGAQTNPVEQIGRQMGHITEDLSQYQTDQPVQDKQKQVLGELDSIIEQLQKQMKDGSGSGSNPNPSKPMTKSQLAKGPGGSGPLHDARNAGDGWGALSPKQREQIMQSQTEGFPPGYESVLSGYFNRLAQEQVGNDAAASPTTQPAK